MLAGVWDGVLGDGELLESTWRSRQLGALLGVWGAERLMGTLLAVQPSPDYWARSGLCLAAGVTFLCQGHSWLPQEWIWLYQFRDSREQWSGVSSPPANPRPQLGRAQDTPANLFAQPQGSHKHGDETPWGCRGVTPQSVAMCLSLPSH